MRCNTIKKILGTFLDEELSERKSKQVRRHLDACSACAWELKSFKKVDELGRWMTEACATRVPVDYWDGFLSNIHERLQKDDKYKQAKIVGFFTLVGVLVRLLWRIGLRRPHLVLLLL